MSTTSDSTVKGKFDELVGDVKQKFGEATNNDSLANKGAAQQVKGHAEQAWGSVKEATNDAVERKQPQAESTGHDIREKITSTAANVKDSIQNGIADLKGDKKKDAA